MTKASTIDQSSKPLIKGSCVAFFPLSRRHLDKCLEWANDPDLSVLMDRERPITEPEHEQWFANLHQQRDCVLFAVESLQSGEYIGNVWLWNIDWCHRKAELRILVGPSECHGKGLGTEIITLASSYAFEVLNLHKIYAYVLSINERAKRAFEKSGFCLEGILKEDRFSRGTYIDVYVLGKINQGQKFDAASSATRTLSTTRMAETCSEGS